METRNRSLEVDGLFGMKCFSGGSQSIAYRRMQAASCKKSGWKMYMGLPILFFPETRLCYVPFQENTKRIPDEEQRRRWSNERKKKVKETFQIKKKNNGLLRKENLPPR